MRLAHVLPEVRAQRDWWLSSEHQSAAAAPPRHPRGEGPLLSPLSSRAQRVAPSKRVGPLERRVAARDAASQGTLAMPRGHIRNNNPTSAGSQRGGARPQCACCVVIIPIGEHVLHQDGVALLIGLSMSHF